MRAVKEEDGWMEEKVQRLDVGFNGRRAWCQKRKRQDGNCLGTYVAFFFVLGKYQVLGCDRSRPKGT